MVSGGSVPSWKKAVKSGTPMRYALLIMDARMTAWMRVLHRTSRPPRPGKASSSCFSQTALAAPLIVEATVAIATT